MSSRILTKPWPYLALFIAHFIWGINFVVAKVTLQEFPTYSLAFLRFALASLLLAPFFIAQTKKVKIKSTDLPKLIAIGICMVTLNIAFFFTGIQKTTAIDASVLTLTIPMLSVLFGWWFLREHIYLINLVGTFIGLLGALIIIGLPQIIIGNYSTSMLIGNLLIVLASLSWVIGGTISRKLLKTYSSLEITGLIFLVGVVTFLIPAISELIKDPAWPTRVSTIGFLGLLYMTLLSSISAYFLFEWGLSRTSIFTADLLQYLEPFVASFFAVLVLSERISTSFIIGAILIGFGVFLGTFAKEIHHRVRHHRH